MDLSMDWETCCFQNKQGLVDDAYELHMLRLYLFPNKGCTGQMAYVVKHPTDGVVCNLSSLAHKSTTES